MFNLKISATTVCLFLLFLPSLAFAQTQPAAQEILQKVSDAYRNLRDYQLEYLTVNEAKTEGNGLKSFNRTEEAYTVTASENRLRVEAKSPSNSVTAVSDGRLTWMYAPVLGLYTKKEQAAAAWFVRPKSGDTVFESMIKRPAARLDDYLGLARYKTGVKLLREEALDFNGKQTRCYVLEISLGQGTTKIVRTYWIDATRYLVLRETAQSGYKQPNGGASDSLSVTTFKQIKLNEALPPSLFAFTPPANASEADRLDYDRRPRPQPLAPKTDWVGQMAPDFTLKDINGRTVSLQSLRGKVVFLNFWATWCGPCVVEMPHLEKLQREYKQKDVVILGIDDEDAETQRELLQEKRYSFNSLVDEGKATGRLYHITAIPQSFFIGRDGKILAYYRGSRKEAELRAGLEAALKGEPLQNAQVVIKPEPGKYKQTADLPAPKLIAPAHGSVFDHYPRQTTLRWEPVEGAVEYRVETDFSHNDVWASALRGGVGSVVTLKATTHTFNFVGAQPGRWRVWAVNAKGEEGAQSGWWEFSYTR
jgi:peroxiredoxin/outer membrane lipoprotein-sorting protein